MIPGKPSTPKGQARKRMFEICLKLEEGETFNEIVMSSTLKATLISNDTLKIHSMPEGHNYFGFRAKFRNGQIRQIVEHNSELSQLQLDRNMGEVILPVDIGEVIVEGYEVLGQIAFKAHFHQKIWKVTSRVSRSSEALATRCAPP